MTGNMVKAIIKPDGKDDIPIQWNPTQYTLEKGNQIAEIGVPGLGAPIIQFVHGNTRSFSCELYFDTYEKRQNVTQHTDKIFGLLAIDAGTHAPPICTLSWGSLSFRCVVEKVSGSFTLFLPDGTPVRAKLNVTFKEYLPVEVLVRQNPTQSADHRKSRVVQLGDTLSNIAFEEYGDAGKWRPIADANHIDNPLSLRPGTLLLIPAIAPGGEPIRA